MDFAQRYQQSLAPVVTLETTLEIDHGEGSHLIAADGTRYLDLATGIAVNAVGYGHPEVLDAIDRQAKRFMHVYAGTGYQDVVVQYAEELRAVLGSDFLIFFGNSGTEAVEAAIKAARIFTGRPAIVAFRGAFHGRSLGSLSLTASAARYRSPYEPLLPSVYHLDYPAPSRLQLTPQAAMRHVEQQMDQLLRLEIEPTQVACIMVEAIQGEGGYVIPPDGFLPWLRELTERFGILLAVDEVQSGLGRTGRMFAYQHASIAPDLVCLAKPLGGGLPLSALAGRRDVMQAWPSGLHGTTFGGNPVACAAGLATLRIIRRDNLAGRAGELGRRGLEILAPLKSFDEIAEIRGLGLMVAVEFSGDQAERLVSRIIAHALRQHLILHPAGVRHEVIRLMPPLNIEAEVWESALRQLIEIIASAIAEARAVG
ncbi:MAG: aspartate aminotransferase family protein [Thermaerobacter sp.]|nr:aspartate aminotransferase family protein [Thermaerobacter sp.]